MLSARFRTQSRAHWLAALDEKGVPCGPVHDMLEALSDPQTLAREMVVEVEHSTLGPVKTIGLPVKFSETPGKVRSGAPVYGEHTREVLGEHGFDHEADRSARTRRRNRFGLRQPRGTRRLTGRRTTDQDKTQQKSAGGNHEWDVNTSAVRSRGRARRHGAGARRLATAEADRVRRNRRPGRRHRQFRARGAEHHHQVQADRAADRRRQQGRRQRRGRLCLRQGLGRRSLQGDLRHVERLAAAARLQGRLQLHRSDADRGDGAGRVPALGQAGCALQDRGRLPEGGRHRANSRWAARSQRTPTRC